MKKFGVASILIFICIMTVLLCACKGGERDEGNPSSADGDHIENETLTDKKEEIGENQNSGLKEEEDELDGIPSDTYDDLFKGKEDASKTGNDKSDSKDNSSNVSDNIKTDETDTPNINDKETPSVEDNNRKEPEDQKISTGEDTETGYGSITGSTP